MQETILGDCLEVMRSFPENDFSAIGIEKQPEYAEIARARISSHEPKSEKPEQMEMFA